MICDLGMSDELGPVSWGESNNEVFLGRQMAASKSYSERTAQNIDAEVKSILSRAYDSARTILVANFHVLEAVAQHLIENESLDADEFASLVARSEPVKPDGLAWMGV